MSITQADPESRTARLTAPSTQLRNPAYQAYLLLRIGFVVAPVLFGLDKFFDVLSTGSCTWPRRSTTSCPAPPTRRCWPWA